jgi:hypothetical protein
MSRDALFIDDLIICTDNAVSVGELNGDTLKVPYETLGYFSARVVLLELLTSGGRPVAYTVGNGTINGYDAIHKGIQKLFSELGYNLPHISSTESNFEVTQSSVSITVIGKKEKEVSKELGKFALIGSPLVGDEVVDGDIASLKEVKSLLDDTRVICLLPVGSSGIQAEALTEFGVTLTSEEVDVNKSSGPSTCLIVTYSDDSLLKDFNLKKLEVA